MAADYDDIVEALATAFAGIDAQVYTGPLAAVQWPAIVIGWPESYDPYTDLGSASDYTIPVRVEVAASRDFKSGNQALRPYIDRTGDYSICAAIDADVTLGGVVDSARVVEFVNFGYREVGTDGTTVVQCEARIEVLA
jgi:hypothetical protein